jgi:putative methyltransferase (TIGR04325 family)
MRSSLLKRLARTLLPKVWLDPLVQRFYRVRWEGDFPDWPAASQASTGYDTAEILATVRGAARRVRDGRARYERDGVAFQEEPAAWPALPHLRRHAAQRAGRLHVLDFGGALGSTYFQYRRQLTEVHTLHWDVVEQAAFVVAGQREFQTAELRFFSTLEAALAGGEPDVLLLSGVLQCLEAPHAWLADFLHRVWPVIILDRVALHGGERDRLTVQRVPRSIYRASYPAWFFQRDRLLAHFAADYELVAEFPNGDAGASGFEFKGFVFARHRP